MNDPGSLGVWWFCFKSRDWNKRIVLCNSANFLCVSKPAFPPKTTAETLLSQIDTGNILGNHERLLEAIGGKIWSRVTSESQLPPSVTALENHVWRATLYFRQTSNPHTIRLDSEGTVLCEKCGYVSMMENQLSIGRIVKLLGEMRRRRKFFWSNVHLRRSALSEITANVEKAVFAVVFCAHV